MYLITYIFATCRLAGRIVCDSNDCNDSGKYIYINLAAVTSTFHKKNTELQTKPTLVFKMTASSVTNKLNAYQIALISMLRLELL